MTEATETSQPGTFDLSVALASCLLQVAYPEHGMILSLIGYILATLLKQTQYHTELFDQFSAFLVLMDIFYCCYRGFVAMAILNTRTTINLMRKDMRRMETINTDLEVKMLALEKEVNRMEKKNESLEQHMSRMSDGEEE